MLLAQAAPASAAPGTPASAEVVLARAAGHRLGLFPAARLRPSGCLPALARRSGAPRTRTPPLRRQELCVSILCFALYRVASSSPPALSSAGGGGSLELYRQPNCSPLACRHCKRITRHLADAPRRPSGSGGRAGAAHMRGPGTVQPVATPSWHNRCYLRRWRSAARLRSQPPAPQPPPPACSCVPATRPRSEPGPSLQHACRHNPRPRSPICPLNPNPSTLNPGRAGGAARATAAAGLTPTMAGIIHDHGWAPSGAAAVSALSSSSQPCGLPPAALAAGRGMRAGRRDSGRRASSRPRRLCR